MVSDYRAKSSLPIPTNYYYYYYYYYYYVSTISTNNDLFVPIWQDFKNIVPYKFCPSIHDDRFVHYGRIGDIPSVASAAQTALSLVFDLAVFASLSLRLSRARFVPRRNF
jgi:hypothetical protein